MIKFFIFLFFFLHFNKCEKINGSNEYLNDRFLQNKTNALTWLTNVLYPSENPAYFKKYLNYRGCREYFSKPSDKPIDLNEGWLQTNNWIMNHENGIIEYKGKDTCREPMHPFPFGWLDNRMSTRTTLIKKDFFCKKTIAQVEIQMNDAATCGLVFRVIGERNYWSLMIDNNILKLVRIKDGELIILKTFPELKINNNEWYVLYIQELIKDIKVKAGIYGDISIDFTRKYESEDEYSNEKQGAVGLLASKGNCKFRNIILRGKKWSSEYEKLKKGKSPLLFDMEEINKLYDSSKDWCPVTAICSKEKYVINKI